MQNMPDAEVVQRYVQNLFPGEIVELEALMGGPTSYRAAMESDACVDNCPGVEKCERYRIITKIYAEEAFGRRIFVPRSMPCRQSQIAARQKRLRDLFVSSRIPAELRGQTIDNYEAVNASTKTARNLALFAVQQGQGVLYAGPPGVGKTHLAVAIAQATVAAGRSALFLPVVNLLDDIREALTNSRLNNLLEELRRVECLVLDDLGLQKDSEWVGERLYEIVNDRYNAGLQLVVTTNARSTEDLASMIGNGGQQIASRLRGMTTMHEIDAPDFRLRKAGKRRTGRVQQTDLDLEPVK